MTYECGLQLSQQERDHIDEVSAIYVSKPIYSPVILVRRLINLSGIKWLHDENIGTDRCTTKGAELGSPGFESVWSM